MAISSREIAGSAIKLVCTLLLTGFTPGPCDNRSASGEVRIGLGGLSPGMQALSHVQASALCCRARRQGEPQDPPGWRRV